MNRVSTDFLCSKSSFISGAATAFNLAGCFYSYNESPSTQSADARAIRNDFAMVGQDIRDSILKLDSKLKADQMELAL